ncbi:extracellular solute-binding protein [Paenibacillus sp. YN15]|uniref:extracellular solute-binding protein n=1 Tax=Paenibacillus sp. YN15 TaxID=1742774 RepID=UPI000DCC5E89|nr:extracellular solute-binding protein [Paenibacillus sp. YN15]RAU96548.1 ABC transporter substrate-binding protein [Paenibacillus sp. YN15]
MNTKWPRLLAASVLTAAMAAGCSSEGGTKEASTAAPSAGASSGPLTLSYWVAMSGDAARSLKSLGDSMFFQELEKRTGVHVNFQHPATGSEKEQFNLMIASGKLPDVIESDFTTYPGGPEKAITDKVIIPLNEIIEKHAPNLKKYLDEHPDVKKEVVTDNGTLYAFPTIGIGNTQSTTGFVVRKDWLDELGLTAPETVDEWTHVLRQFKEKKGAKTPMTFTLSELNLDRLNGAYGIGYSFYLDNGKVKYGPYEPGYKNYMAQLNAWYKEGLIDPDFAAQDTKAKEAKITNGTAGAFPSYIGPLGKYLLAMQPANPKVDFVATQHPVLKKGDQPTIFSAAYTYRGQGSAGITTANKNPAETAKWLDYLYSEEGHILKSFGVEGVTFNMVNGYPTYTDLILKNPDNLSVAEAMSKYLRVATPSPGFVGDPRYGEQYNSFQQQKDASQTFNVYFQNLEKTRMPRVMETTDEGQELSSLMSEIETYRSEMFLKFVMGAEPLSNFDKYQAQLKSMKIERAIAIKQSALERYYKRK